LNFEGVIMRWPYRLPEPFVLIDGGKVSTLAEARDLMLALPELHQSKAHWRYAGELLKVAAQHGEKYAVMDARAQFARALMAEGLILPEVAKPQPAIRAIRARAMRARSRLKASA
jgi:hypothetical protein